MKTIIFKGKKHFVNTILNGFAIKETPQSSNVECIAICAETSELFIKFRGKNLAQYLYTNVDANTLHDILKADSVGAFVQSRLKGKYTATKLNTDLFTPVEE